VPDKIQKALWQHRDEIDNIMVIAEEPFIPWEVVHIVEPGKPLGEGTRFLGELGLVRWLHKAGWPKESIPIGKGRAYYLIPNYSPPYDLPQTCEEAKYLRETFDAQAVEPTSAAVRKLLSTPDAFDLLHFAGHGEAENDNNRDASLLLQVRFEEGNRVKDTFSATTAMAFSNLRRNGQPGPMIVLNACQVGQASYKLTGTGGFAEAFLTRGASVFVGALWSIGDAPARIFTEEFYSQIKDKKVNIAEATKNARAKAKMEGEATWLAYVVYGHPQAKFT
jgi:CHAT domain-containing protein